MGKKHVETEMTSQKSGFTQVPKDFFIVWCGDLQVLPTIVSYNSLLKAFAKASKNPRTDRQMVDVWWFFQVFSSKDHPKNQDENWKTIEAKRTQQDIRNTKDFETLDTNKSWWGKFSVGPQHDHNLLGPRLPWGSLTRGGRTTARSSSRVVSSEIEGHPKCWEITKST